MQAVPTSVEDGRDGQYYVGQLTGFPFPVGGANIYRVNPRTGAASVFASGFTNIMDLAFGKDGTLYVLEIDHNSLLPPDNGDEGAIFAIPPAPSGGSSCPPALCRSPAASRSATTASTSRSTPPLAGDGKVVRIRAR